MILPTIHFNGSDPERLYKDVTDCLVKFRETEELLAKLQPHGRDYYPQGDEALWVAMNQHEARCQRLKEVKLELELLAEYLYEQTAAQRKGR